MAAVDAAAYLDLNYLAYLTLKDVLAHVDDWSFVCVNLVVCFLVCATVR